MKSLLLSVLCFFHIVAHTTTYYVSTTGNDANPGTIGSPFFTWEKLSTVLVAGDIAYIRGGIYRSGKGPASPWLVQWFNINGTAGNPINILAYPGESPVMDLSNVLSTVNGFGIYVRNCNYVNFKGLRITGWQQNPSGNSFFLWNNENCTNLKIEQCEVDNSQCYGFFDTNCTGTYYLNCDAHHLGDPYNPYVPYNGASGFSATGAGNTSTNLTYEGCRAWWVTDNGWAFFGSNGIFTIKNCWAFWGGYIPGTFTACGGDGVGYKMGPVSPAAPSSVRFTVTNCLAFENRNFGFDQNSANCLYHLYNNTAFSNGLAGYAFGYFPLPQVFRNNIGFNSPDNYYGAEIYGDHNSWNPGVTLTNADFISVLSVGMDGARQTNGSLPTLNFLKLDPSSDLINAGVNVGLPYSGAVPDIGAFEYNTGNTNPTANAGPNQNITLPANSVTINGSGTDPDGTITAYQWTKIAGPATFTIVSPAQASTVINNLVQGVYQFELRVTDNQSALASDTVVVTVNASTNQAPTANAGPNQNITLPTNSVTINGSGSDPDGTITAYQWTKIAGPVTYTIVSPTQASTVINNLVQGVYQFELRVTDNQSALGRDTVIITVNAAATNQAPTANAGPNQNITLPINSLTLNGGGTDPDGTITAYQWTKIAGPATFTIVSPAQVSTVINNLVQGVYQFELRVTDNQSALGRDTIIITVNAATNQIPSANAGLNQNITLPTNSLTLNGSGADPDGTITAYQWTKIAGPASFTIVSPAQASTVINNLVQGVYQFELRVTDNQGAFGRDTVLVTVNATIPNQAPTANAGSDQTITLPANSLTLNGSGTDPDGTITAYQWTKIAGPATFTIISPAQASTVINNLVEGVYQFELRVTDNQGAFGISTVIVTVNAAPSGNQAPVVNAGGNMTMVLPDNSVLLTGSGTDPDGTIVDYRWTKITGPVQFDILTPGLAQTVVKDLAEGVYQFQLKATDNNGASAIDTVEVTIKRTLTSGASIFPNPVKDIMNLKIEETTVSGPASVAIYDMSGKILYHESFIRNQITFIKQINVSGFGSGAYIVKVISGITNNMSIKMIKQ